MCAQADLFDEKSCPERPSDQNIRKPKASRKSKGAVASPTKAQFLTIETVMKRYAISQATVWRWVKDNPHFPEPVKLSSGTSRWLESQLVEFEKRAQSHQGGKHSKTSKMVSS